MEPDTGKIIKRKSRLTRAPMPTQSAFTPLIARLKRVPVLNDGDVQAIERLPIELKVVKGGQPIVCTGDRPSACCLIVDGFVIRAKSTSDGKRQILAIHQPGDIPDLQSLYLHVMDHEVSALGESVLGFIPMTTCAISFVAVLPLRKPCGETH